MGKRQNNPPKARATSDANKRSAALLSRSEAARELGISVTHVRRLELAGRLPFTTKHNGFHDVRWFRFDDVDALRGSFRGRSASEDTRGGLHLGQGSVDELVSLGLGVAGELTAEQLVDDVRSLRGLVRAQRHELAELRRAASDLPRLPRHIDTARTQPADQGGLSDERRGHVLPLGKDDELSEDVGRERDREPRAKTVRSRAHR